MPDAMPGTADNSLVVHSVFLTYRSISVVRSDRHSETVIYEGSPLNILEIFLSVFF